METMIAEATKTETTVNEYVSDGKNRYLRIECDGTVFDGHELKMLRENRPEGLLRVHPQWEGDSAFLDYQVSGLTTLSSVGDGSAETFLFAVLSNLVSLSDVLSEHLLRPEGLSLKPERVFLRRESGQIFFCYVPGSNVPLSEGLTSLMEFFLKNARPEKEDEVLLLYGLYQKSREENVTLRTLLQYWRSETAHAAEARTEGAGPEKSNPRVVSFPDDDPWEKDGDDLFSLPDEDEFRVTSAPDPEKNRGPHRSVAKDQPEKKTKETLTEKAKARMEPLLQKLPEKVRERFFEIVIALIVVIGAVLFFVI